MRWGSDVSPDERRLRDNVRDLIAVRNQRAALRTGSFETLHADPDTWAFLRAVPGAGVLVVLNKGVAAAEVTVALPATHAYDRASDALAAEGVRLAGRTLTLTVPAGGYRVIDLQ
jgi:hypothetical protein